MSHHAHGVGYSLDGHRLLFVRHTFKDSEYIVPDGVVTICSMAFGACRQFVTLIIPRSVRLIGDFVFGPEGGKIVIKEPPSARRQNLSPLSKLQITIQIFNIFGSIFEIHLHNYISVFVSCL